MLILAKRSEWFHSSREVALVSMSGVNVFDLDLWVLLDYATKPIKRNSVGSGHVSLCWTSVFDDHFDHRFITLRNVKQGARTRRFNV